jgi:hypothetical protein
VNIFALEVWDDEGSKCTFYSVRWDGATMNETDKFFNKFYAGPKYNTAAQQLMSFVIDSIGEDYGAISPLFNRFENQVTGLPNKGNVQVGEVSFNYPDFPLRLYAIRVMNRSDLVVLFNGGIKSGATNQQSKNLNLKWIEACRFADRIEEAIRNGEIKVDLKNRKISNFGNKDEILL